MLAGQARIDRFTSLVVKSPVRPFWKSKGTSLQRKLGPVQTRQADLRVATSRTPGVPVITMLQGGIPSAWLRVNPGVDSSGIDESPDVYEGASTGVFHLNEIAAAILR